MGSVIWRTVNVLALAYGCYGLLCFFAQRLIIYPGRSIRASAVRPDPAAGILPVWLEGSFGRVESWFLAGEGRPTGRRPVVLVFHGNGEIIDFLAKEMEGFRKQGIGVLLVEYPGFGRSTGKPSEESITAVGVAAYDTLVRRGDVDPTRVLAFGRSLGCGPACALARQRPLAALILQSPFTSTRPFARRFFLPGFLVRDVYDNRAALAVFTGPVLILHGRDDDIVPFAHGRELARISSRARFVELACAHNDCPPDWGEFWRIVGDFLHTQGIV
jgi:uncharacterized protein